MPLSGLGPRRFGSGRGSARPTLPTWPRARATSSRGGLGRWPVRRRHNGPARSSAPPATRRSRGAGRGIAHHPRRRGDLGRRMVDRPRHGRGWERYGSGSRDAILTASGASKWATSTLRPPYVAGKPAAICVFDAEYRALGLLPIAPAPVVVIRPAGDDGGLITGASSTCCACTPATSSNPPNGPRVRSKAAGRTGWRSSTAGRTRGLRIGAGRPAVLICRDQATGRARAASPVGASRPASCVGF